jgi:RNA polymerase sigma-70 factor (ECF subfamily)
MTLTSKEKVRTEDRRAPSPWAAAWYWLARPTRYRAVHNFRVAAENGDEERLAALLDATVAVVVETGDEDGPTIRVVVGKASAMPVLVHGFTEPDLVIEERAVNGQAGLIFRRDGEMTAAVTVDFEGPYVSVVWVRLQPERLRHWNHV